MFVNFENLDVVDYLRSGALLVAFIAVFLADRKNRDEGSVWLKADVITLGAVGAGLFLFPSQLLGYMSTVKTDVVHEGLCRNYGATFIGLALMWRHYSDDRTPQTAWLLVRSLAGLTAIQCMIFSQTNLAGQKIHMTDQHVTFFLFMVCLSTMGNIYHLLKRGNFGSVRRSWTTSDSTTVHLLVDILIMLPLGFSLLILPDWWLSLLDVKDFKPDVIHQMLLQFVGLSTIMSRFLFIMSLGFADDKDRRAVFYGNLWTVVLITPWGIFYQVKYHFHSPTSLIIMSVVNLVVPVLNSLIAAGCLPSPAKLFHRKRA